MLVISDFANYVTNIDSLVNLAWIILFEKKNCEIIILVGTGMLILFILEKFNLTKKQR